jgi:hypothetical protein
MLGQAVTCEPTPEGGKRCSDGTYLPPGCPTGSPETVQGQPSGAGEGFPILPAALALVGVAAAGAYLLSGRGKRLGAEPTETLATLQDVASSIQSERASDAWHFAQVVAKTKENTDLLYREKAAEDALAEQNRIWETTHKNPDALQIATINLETIAGQRAAVKAEIDDFRARVNQNAQNVVTLRNKAMYLISTLPEELQVDARRIFDPCFKSQTMQGAFLGQIRLI